MHATRREFNDLGDHIIDGCIDGFGCAKLPGDRELAGVAIDRNDASRAGKLRSIDRRQSDATDAENGDRRARFYSRAARDRAIACDDTATNQRCKIEWHFIGDFDQRVFVNDHLLCKR